MLTFEISVNGHLFNLTVDTQGNGSITYCSDYRNETHMVVHGGELLKPIDNIHTHTCILQARQSLAMLTSVFQSVTKDIT